MKTLLATSLLASTLCACAVDAPSELEITLAPADGKHDHIAGKKLRFREVSSVIPWIVLGDPQHDELANLATRKTVTVHLATDDVAVVSGTSFLFPGTSAAEPHEHGLPWYGNTILELAATTAAPNTEMGLYVLHTDASTRNVTFVECSRDGRAVNLFSTIAIDLVNEEIHTEDKTFTFAQCGLGSPRISELDVIPLPLTTAGDIEGTYAYYLWATFK